MKDDDAIIAAAEAAYRKEPIQAPRTKSPRALQPRKSRGSSATYRRTGKRMPEPIVGDVSWWHDDTATAVLKLVKKLELLGSGQGWDLDDEFSVWRRPGGFQIQRDGVPVKYFTASDVVSYWLNWKAER